MLTLEHLAREIARRRTFAIISHPDAGKTTLTEKLLLYSGMTRTAGMVRGRKGGKLAASDWMAMEQERGISITASAMQFPYKDVLINVLDTPGHQDFSDDTYRTLTAADAAVMVIDSTKGVEAQTKKLFAVCRMRSIPVLTFINKMDLPANDPFDLMHEVEEVLGINASPLNWPVGYGKEFRGVVDVQSKDIYLFQRNAGGALKAGVSIKSLAEAQKDSAGEEKIFTQLDYELQLLKEAGNPFDHQLFLAGKVTPVFFGSAMTNFGVEPFFDSFVKLAPAPFARSAIDSNGHEIKVDPLNTPFSAYVFKIQTNMNPKHRDSTAFLRVCSGEFSRDQTVLHHRLDKTIRMTQSHSLAAGERTIIEQAFPGDIIGVVNPGVFAIGDTVSAQGGFAFRPLPQFPPEVVAQIRPVDVAKRKSFDKGIRQLAEEGAVQVLRSWSNPQAEPYVAAVGRLQFEVLQYRLREEYGVDTRLEQLPLESGSWLEGDVKTFRKPTGALLMKDRLDRPVVLFSSAWEKRYAAEQNPQHGFIDYQE